MLGETERVNRPSKYARLAGQLAAAGAMIIELTFAEVDKLIPGGLPESAYRYRTWWTSNAGNSAQSRHGWTGAGYRVSRVDLTNGVVVFAKQPDCPAIDHPEGPSALGRRVRVDRGRVSVNVDE